MTDDNDKIKYVQVPIGAGIFEGFALRIHCADGTLEDGQHFDISVSGATMMIEFDNPLYKKVAFNVHDMVNEAYKLAKEDKNR